MSASNYLETAFAEQIFEKTPIPGLEAGDANLYFALHTADPGEGGTQATSEADYTGYGRVAVARLAAQWTVASGQGSNVNPVTFGQATAGSNNVTHYSVGLADGTLLWVAQLSAPLAVTAGITPEIPAGAAVLTIN